MSTATDQSSATPRRRRFPLTLAAVAASAIAIPLYIGMDAADSAEADAPAVAESEPAPQVAAHDVSTATADGKGKSASVVESRKVDPLAPSPAAEEAPMPAATPAPHGGAMVDLAADGEASVGGEPALRKTGGRSTASLEAERGEGRSPGYQEQLRVNRLTAGRTSDLQDRTSIDELRELAVRHDSDLAQAIRSNKAVGATPQAGHAAQVLDIGLVLDTTGSMGDELAYLKVELRSIAEAVAADFPGVTQRYALVAYRDHGDEYVVRHHEFAPIDEFIAHLGRESAGGGGDHPEAMDEAMAAAAQLQWSSSDAAQMVFLVADAPPHTAGYQNYVEATGSLGARGVAVYPVASSGVATVCEYLMRWAARTTGGQYLFLTDHSGIGGAHAEAHVEQYELKTLRDHMLEVIRLELGADGDVLPQAQPVHRDAPCLTSVTQHSSWLDRHGAFVFVLGGVFLLGFAIDMAMSHARRRA